MHFYFITILKKEHWYNFNVVFSITVTIMSIIMVSRYLSQSKQLHSCGLCSVELCTLRPSYWIFPTSLLMVSYYIHVHVHVQLPQFKFSYSVVLV